MFGWIAVTTSRTVDGQNDMFRIIYFARQADVIGVDASHLNPHGYGVSRPDGRSRNRRKAAGEESPGSIDMRCRITPGGGNPRESATENEPPCVAPKGAKQGKGEKVR